MRLRDINWRHVQIILLCCIPRAVPHCSMVSFGDIVEACYHVVTTSELILMSILVAITACMNVNCEEGKRQME